MDPLSLFVSLVAGCIGFAAWQYGRRRSSARHLVLGLVLMVYPWAIDDPLVAVGIGAALSLFLVWR